jgi:uroporphyrinogen decarboxylase
MDGRQRMLLACSGGLPDRPPVWLMRQAGRYLPEYRELRAKYSFGQMIRTPEVAVEATLQPLRRFPVDAAILFSDILTVLDAGGAGVAWDDGGPRIHKPFTGPQDLDRLRSVVVSSSLAYVGEAVARLREVMPPGKALIGFAGAPLTLAAYFVEGGASRDLRSLKALFYQEPALASELLGALADLVGDLLRMQVDAGAEVVQIFDTWAGLLSPWDWAAFGLPAVRRAIARIGRKIPVILYLRGAASHLDAALESGASVLSIDASMSLSAARARVGPTFGLQGNLDPAELLAPPKHIRTRVLEMIREAGPAAYVVNLGQGLFPEVPISAVETFVGAVCGIA